MPTPPPLPLHIRTRPERLTLVFAAAAGLVASLLLLARSAGFAPPPCVWKCATGVPCAGCGGTRALATLLVGSPLDALAWNPAAVVAAIVVLLAGIYAACVLALRLEPWRPAFVSTGRWKIVVVMCVAVNWLYLLLAGRV